MSKLKPRGSRPGETGDTAVHDDELKYIVDDKGDRTAVIIPINEYEQLMEDLHDLAVIAERRDEPTTSFEELKKKLRADGLL
jgi:PHD/YefM family antitoxin component YafN of YafNO toxin-antitoxin module